jgi:hypothetical protein
LYNEKCTRDPHALIDEIFEGIWQDDIRFIYVLGKSVSDLAYWVGPYEVNCATKYLSKDRVM